MDLPFFWKHFRSFTYLWRKLCEHWYQTSTRTERYWAAGAKRYSKLWFIVAFSILCSCWLTTPCHTYLKKCTLEISSFFQYPKASFLADKIEFTVSDWLVYTLAELHHVFLRLLINAANFPLSSCCSISESNVIAFFIFSQKSNLFSASTSPFSPNTTSNMTSFILR